MFQSLIESIAIRPRLRQMVLTFFRNNLAHDIQYQMRLRALNSTCDYIEQNLPTAQLYNKTYDAVDHALKAVSIEGSYSEFGVWKGKSVNYIAKTISKPIHAFDSFEGLPETWLTSHKKGHFAVKELPLFAQNVVVHQGWFDATLPKFIESNNENIAFLHIDCDLYSSTKTIFEFLGDRIVEGTIILFDEYFNYPQWEHHEYKAFQEFVTQHNIQYEYLCYSSCRFGSKVAVKITKKG